MKKEIESTKERCLREPTGLGLALPVKKISIKQNKFNK